MSTLLERINKEFYNNRLKTERMFIEELLEVKDLYYIREVNNKALDVYHFLKSFDDYYYRLDMPETIVCMEDGRPTVYKYSLYKNSLNLLVVKDVNMLIPIFKTDSNTEIYKITINRPRDTIKMKYTYHEKQFKSSVNAELEIKTNEEDLKKIFKLISKMKNKEEMIIEGYHFKKEDESTYLGLCVKAIPIWEVK